jgi:replicative DNA helicase
MEKTKNRNWIPRQSLTDIGRIQPQARELEEAVLGALLIESKAYALIEDILMADDFYDSIHQTIYRSILNLSAKRKPIDMLTVVEELRSMGELETVGGPVYIAQLTEKVASAAHLEYHAQVIKQKAQARQLIGITSCVQQMAFDETTDISDTIEELDKSLTEIVNRSSGSQSMTMRQAITMALDKASEIQQKAQSGVNPSITTGLRSLDEEFDGGWRPPELIILGARPSMGKTQIALSFAKAAGLSDNEVLFISIEMTAIEQYKKESEVLHHCLYKSEYHLRPDSLILSASILGQRLETVELSLKNWKILQCQGLNNENSDYHDQILQLVEKNINKIAKIINENGTKKNTHTKSKKVSKTETAA